MANRLLRRKMLYLAMLLVLLASSPLAMARSKPDPDKQAHKVAKKLAHFKQGALVHLVFANNTESTGALGQLGEHSFTLLNVETNARETHSYAEVESIRKGSNEIGEGTRRNRRGPF